MIRLGWSWVLRNLYCKSVMHLKKGSLSFGGVCRFLLLNKDHDASPLTATHHPISSSLVHLASGATPFFCSLFGSAQTLDSRTPGKCSYSFLLLVFRLPRLHPLYSLTLDYYGSGFEVSLLFVFWAWIGVELAPATMPDSSSSLLFASCSAWILETPTPSQGHVWDFII